MTRFLASVATIEEMDVVRDGGADIVDLKDPRRGALGAWEAERLRAAVAHWRRWTEPMPLLSATIGDRQMDARPVFDAAEAVAATEVAIVKIGIENAPGATDCIAALGELAKRTKLVAVLLADRSPDFSLLPLLARHGWFGAMLDTAGKTDGGLRRHLADDTLDRFVREASALGLVTGLAGSLGLEDVEPLAGLGPDYLGFRGGLCRDGRTGAIDSLRVRRIRAAIDAGRSALDDEDFALPAAEDRAGQARRL